MKDKHGDYRFLPKKFRDFHDQKDLFKTMDFIQANKNRYVENIDWVSAHNFCTDYFLYYMARIGYTLQKDERFKTHEYEDDLKKFQEKIIKEMKAILNDRS